MLRRPLEEHRELRREAEQQAASVVGEVDRDDVAARVVEVYLRQSVMEIGERCGRQPGGGYVEEGDAQWQLLEEVLDPFLDEVDRLARIGHRAAAGRQTLGTLDGLARVGEVAGEDTVIGWGDVQEHTHVLADWARRRAEDAGVDLEGSADGGEGVG